MLSPAKSVNPLTVLPVELAEMVLEHLAFRHLVNCMRVSRGWRDYIAKLPRLWVHLDLSGARRPVPRKFVDKAVRRSEYRLTRVTIHRFEHVDILKNVAKACKDLTELEFISLPHAMSKTLVDVVQSAPKLEKFVVHPQITIGTAIEILSSHKTLKHIGFNAIKESQWTASWQGPYNGLETCNMHFENTTTRSSASLDLLLYQTPRLKTLNFSKATVSRDFLMKVMPATNPCPWLQLTTLVMRQVEFPHFPILPPTLQKLVIEYKGSYELLHGEANWTHQDMDLLQSRLPALTHLALSDINMLSADRIEDMLDLYIDNENPGHVERLQDAAPLQSLSIRGVVYDERHGQGLFKSNVHGLFTRSPRILTPALQYLDMATLPVNDNEIELLLQYKTGITSIDISYTQITGASIKMLVDGLPGLRTIKADNCPQISGRDAIEYARRKGVIVSCSMGEGKGSRKVRYG
jgi:F-box/TPR repeat protein Pof3